MSAAKVLVLALLTLHLFLPAGAGAQEEGFVVIEPIDNGPATVFVDGREVSTLNEDELTLTVLAGARRISVEKPGFEPFRETVTVPSGDVVRLRVRLVSSSVRILEDTAQAGVTRQRTTALRVIHLEPVRVPIQVAGREVGQTPATLQVPVGNVELRVGSTELCLAVDQQVNQRIRIRGGAVEELQNVRTCADAAIPLLITGIPPSAIGSASTTVDGHRVPVERAEAGLLLKLPEPGRHFISIEDEDHLPLGFDVESGPGDSLRVSVDLGDSRPTPPTRARTSEPKRPQYVPPRPPVRPAVPDTAAYYSARNGLAGQRSAQRLKKTLKVAGYATVIGGWGMFIAAGIMGPTEPASNWLGSVGLGLGLVGWYPFAKLDESINVPSCAGCQRTVREFEQSSRTYSQRIEQWNQRKAHHESVTLPAYETRYQEQVEEHAAEMAAWEDSVRRWDEYQRRLADWRRRVLETRRDPVIRIYSR